MNPNLDKRVGQKMDPEVQWQCCRGHCRPRDQSCGCVGVTVPFHRAHSSANSAGAACVALQTLHN